jgi:hypothetical protein
LTRRGEARAFNIDAQHIVARTARRVGRTDKERPAPYVQWNIGDIQFGSRPEQVFFGLQAIQSESGEAAGIGVFCEDDRILYCRFSKLARLDGYEVLPGRGRFGQVGIDPQCGMFFAR